MIFKKSAMTRLGSCFLVFVFQVSPLKLDSTPFLSSVKDELQTQEHDNLAASEPAEHRPRLRLLALHDRPHEVPEDEGRARARRQEQGHPVKSRGRDKAEEAGGEVRGQGVAIKGEESHEADAGIGVEAAEGEIRHGGDTKGEGVYYPKSVDKGRQVGLGECERVRG